MDYRQQIDYSSLSTYLTCPRKFYFQYVLHLRPDGPPNLDLIFGSCWHLGLERAYQALSQGETSFRRLADLASEGFNLLWESEAQDWFDPDASFPKSPTRAADMYYQYFFRFTKEDSQAQVIANEDPFTIHLGANLPDYIGRLDLGLLRDGELELYEHKTAKYANEVTYLGYKNSLQCEGYLTAGYLYFEKLPRIIYNVALCQKTKIDFYRWSITKQKSKIDRFIWELTRRCEDLLQDLACSESWESTKKEAVLPWFLRNPGMSCTQFFRSCEYYDLCLTRNNPTLWREKPPAGYIFSEWDPATHEETMRQKLEKEDPV